MKPIVKTLAASMLFALSLSSMPASAAKFGVTMSAFDDNFLTVLRNNIKAHAATKQGVEVQFEDAQNDVGRQLNQIQNFIAQKVDAIIVNTVDSEATPKMTKLATDAGIPLVYVNRIPADKTLPANVSFVGSNDLESGTLQMKEVCKLMGGKGNIVILVGDLSNQAARERTEDIKDVIKTPACSGIKILDERIGNFQRTQGTDITMNWISSGLKFDAILSNNDEMALGAIQALKASKLLDKTIVAGIDGTQDAMAAMKAGDLKVTVFQNAADQGKGALETAIKLVKGEKVESKVWVPFELITPANLNSYMSRN